MHLLRILAIVFIFHAPVVWSQEHSSSINYSLGITRFDFFTGFEYLYKMGRIEPFGGIEVGVNRTIFQQRFYPKIKIGTNYLLVNKERVILGPSFTYAYSMLNVNKSTSSYHRWHELFLGFRFLYGQNLKIGFTVNGGYAAERYPNQYTLKTEVLHMSGYHGAILLNYAL